ncbi:MAG TPA: rod-binding protein [Bryobacteraceae bacterium]|nr:rod-binding protein [Bryobacteraceae bacterium]
MSTQAIPGNRGLASPDTGVSAGKETPKKMKDAALQFEALLLAQMLRSARESGSPAEGEDNSSEAIRDMADQQFAQILAAGGGMGLAKLILQGLSEKPSPEPIK